MTWRLYFNRCEDWPQIWSIDSGDVSTECNVVGWRLEPGVTARAGRVDNLSGVDRAREPVAWMAIEAVNCRIECGVAVFTAIGPPPASNWRMEIAPPQVPQL